MPKLHMHMLLIGAAHASLSLRSTAPSQFSPRPSKFRRRLDAPRSCICINCKWIDRCEVYHWVEKQHEQPHVTDSPDFEPVEPQVQVFIRNQGEEAAVLSNRPDEGAEGADGVNAAVLTTEYDVFKCDSFVEDAGKWLRLMPDAGFVPT